jgi:hypothetical protein
VPRAAQRRQTSARRSAIATHNTALEALTLRSRGVPYDEIAVRLSLPESEVRLLVAARLEAERGVRTTSRVEARALAQRRAEVALGAVMPMVADGDLFAVDRMLKLNDQLIRLGELPDVRPDVVPSASYEDDAMTFIRRALAQAQRADLSDLTLPELLKAIGPLLDRLERKDNDGPQDERLARITHLLETARARGVGVAPEGATDVEPDGVQEEGDAGL